jgi:L,D-transpeptidase catalytic domain
MRRAFTARIVFAAALLSGLFVSTAGAATTSVARSKSTAARVATASATLYLPDAFFVHHAAVTVPGRRIHLGAVVRPYVPGQSVIVRAFLGRHLIKSDRLEVRPSRNHNFGTFTESLSSSRAGKVTVTVTHAATATLASFNAERTFSVLDERIGPGSSGPFVALIQQRLAALHFYIPHTGIYDQGMELALDAYHRLLRWGTYKSVDGRTISYLLDGWGEFKVRYPGHGRHAEGNLSDQLLALIDGSKVDMIFPISSGKPSTPTVLGNFHVYSRSPGLAPDGMYYSSYFIGGYAIHGYNPAPDHPASHGCMRLPMTDAITVYNWLDYGDAVDVYN